VSQHIFLHIPKTAGSSVRTLLQQNYPAAATLGFSGDPEPLRWYGTQPSDEKRRYALVHGHFYYGIHAGLTQYSYFTFLRAPVARHFSDYDFLRRYEPHPLHAVIHKEGITPQGWATISRRFARFRNILTRFVSGEPDSWQVDRLALEKAKLHVRREFALVGLAERFDESVLMLARRLGWRSVFYLTRNVTGDRTQPTPEMMTDAAEGLRYDLELYEFGRELFEQLPELKSSEFEDALAEYREVRTWLEGHVTNNPQEVFVVGQELPRLDDIVRRNRTTPALDRFLGLSLGARVSMGDTAPRETAGASADPIQDASNRAWHSLMVDPPRALPTAAMMKTTGSASTEHYLATMREYLADVIRHTKLAPTARLLDLGCGCGRLATGLARYLEAGGEYCGIDVWQDGIDWCRQHLTGTAGEFSFHTVAAANNYYFADDTGEANAFDLSGVPSHHFDAVVALSLFSHLKYADTRQYLELIARALTADGRAYLTFFVVDPDARRFMAETGNHQSLQRNDDGMWYAYSGANFFAGYEPETLQALFSECGLEVEAQAPGSWAKKPNARLYEDWFLLKRR
jgi:cyclopropane fatty-acyl-phospholipid synthase-like methyltransferase